MKIMVEERVKKVLSNVFAIEQNNISDDSSPDTIKNWTSLGHMNLIVALEEEFKTQFNELQIVEMMNYPLILCTIKEIMAA